jgi:putative Holliday junction resolvase
MSEDRAEFPARGRLLGLDFGTKRIGIAVSNEEQTIASPLEGHTRRSERHDAEQIARLAREFQAVGLVVGLPVHMSGDEGEQARRARAFGEWIARETGLPLRFWDERYTSSIAEMHLLSADLSKKKRQARIDKLAAQIMLQAYLDADDRAGPAGPYGA